MSAGGDAQLHREIGEVLATQRAMMQRLESIERREGERDRKFDDMHRVITRAEGSWKAMVGMGSFGAIFGGLLVKMLAFAGIGR